MSDFWAAFGLQRTPFFQEPLATEAPGAELDRFFVGREAELRQALLQLTHDRQTRVVVVGAPGVGKTSFLNQLVARLRAAPSPAGWLIPALPPISLPGVATHVDFCIEVLRRALDARRQLPGRGATVRRAAGAARAALAPDADDIWERAARAVHGATTMAPQVLGVGLATHFIPPAPNAASWVGLAIEVLDDLVRRAGRDVLITLNNAENMAAGAAATAQGALRDARDVLLRPGVHWLFVGTPDFHDTVIAGEPRLSGIMQHPLTLAPFAPPDVVRLLERRYGALRTGRGRALPPVASSAVAALARAFSGDLRELLRALEAAVLALAPVRGAASLELAEVVGVVSRLQRERLAAWLPTAAWRHLATVVLGTAPDGPLVQRFREADAVRRLAPMRQPTVHAHKRRWIEGGLVRASGHSGAAEWLTVTGPALLALWPEVQASGRQAEAIVRAIDLQQAEATGAPAAPARRDRPARSRGRR
ncbi:MAG: hypothetical protein NW201_10920 [Gemmatimonadales bacterium]|nr:hypothetical protein [Gemmatimonadales bacterium]